MSESHSNSYFSTEYTNHQVSYFLVLLVKSMRGLKIQLDSNNGSNSYSPGDTLTGCVITDLTHEEKITGVRLKWIGLSQVTWTEPAVPDVNQIESYDAEEYYFHHREYLLGREGGPELILPSGFQSFPFTHVLPQGLPSTFQGKYGSVQYFVTVMIKRKWKLGLGLKSKLHFVVNGSLDLNLNLRAVASDAGGRASKSTTLGCLCWESGPIGFNLKMDLCDFVPGEILQATAELYNFSSKCVRKTKINLVMECTFHAKGKVKHTNYKVIGFERGPPIPPGESIIWDCSESGMRIPPTPPTDLGGCRLIDVQYSLQIVIKIPRRINVSAEIPIVIGTIPLRNTNEDPYVLTTSTLESDGQIHSMIWVPEGKPIESVPLLLEDMLPPTYKDVMDDRVAMRP